MTRIVAEPVKRKRAARFEPQAPERRRPVAVFEAASWPEDHARFARDGDEASPLREAVTHRQKREKGSRGAFNA